jgi:acetyl esterase/lipase
MASIRSRIVRKVTGLYLKSVNSNTADVQRMRRKWHAFAKLLSVARGVRRDATVINGLPAEWLVPAGADNSKVLLYFHGGAYLMGSCATHRQLVSHIAVAAGVKALLPEYRLAPEHRFPAAVDDAVGIYQALLSDGFLPHNIAVAGDSAGGGLTMAMLITLRDRALPLPAFAALLSPWLDMTGTGESMRTRAQHDPWFRPTDLGIVTGYYCEPEQLRDPRVSPVYADLSGLPPLYVQVGEDEILLSDSERAAGKIRATGGEVELEVWPGMWHVFQAFVHQVPEAKKAIQRLGQRISGALHADKH